ncbi:MAG: hypothetical protein ACUVQR_01685 [Thermogutta sp.]
MADDHLLSQTTPANEKGATRPIETISSDTSQYSGGSNDRDSSQNSDGSPNDRELGFRAVARQITGWTSNLLVTFLILAAGLAFGVQVLIWWKDVPSDRVLSSMDIPAENPVTSESWAEFYGVSSRFSCVTFQADEKVAIRQCQEMCLKAAQRAALPSGPPDLAEQDVLGKLADLSPVCEGPNGLRVYRYPGDFPVWVGVKRAGGETTNYGGAKSEGAPLETGSRIVAWTFLVSLGKRDWSIYQLATDATGRSKQPSIALSDTEFAFPLPPGASVMSRFSPGSGTFFEIFEEIAPGTSATWTLFLDQELPKIGWEPIDNWLRGPARQRRSFRRKLASAEQFFLTVEIIQKSDRPARGLVFGLRWSTGNMKQALNQIQPETRGRTTD